MSRRPVWILHVFVVGLALHNFAMAELYAAGVCAATRSRSSRPGRTRCSRSGSLLVWRARGYTLRLRPPRVDWLALGYGASSSSRAVLPQQLARRRRDPPRRRPRRPRGPAAGRRLLLRPRPRPDPASDARRLGVTHPRRGLRPSPRSASSTSTRSRSPGGASSGAPGWFTDQLGFTYKGLSGLPAELRLQPRQRAGLPPARLGLPLAARDLLHARDGAARSRPPGGCSCGRGSPSGCRRPRSSTPACSGRTRAAPTSRSRSVSSSMPPCSPQRGRLWLLGSAARGRRRRPRLRQGLPPHRAEDELHPRRSSSRTSSRTQPGRRPGRRRQRSRGREHHEPLAEPAATGSRPSSATRRATAPATPARPRRGRTCRSSPASRPTPSSGSTPASPAASSSSPGRWRSSGASRARAAFLTAALVGDARARPADRHHRRALGRLRPLAARRLAGLPPGGLSRGARRTADRPPLRSFLAV